MFTYLHTYIDIVLEMHRNTHAHLNIHRVKVEMKCVGVHMLSV